MGGAPRQEQNFVALSDVQRRTYGMPSISASQQMKSRTRSAARARIAAAWLSRGRCGAACVLAVLGTTVGLNAESASQSATAASHSAPSIAGSSTYADPKALARQCAAREAQTILHPNSFLRYRMHVVDEKGDQVREQIETPEGSVARLLLRDGKPLTPEEDAAERGRLSYLLDSPASFAHHIKNEQANKKMGVDLLNLMPEAMLWSYAPGQPAIPGHGGTTASSVVVLDFKPNPAWNPPSMAAEALTGLAGRIWIDAESQQMLHLEGSLIKPVNVGWGMVAHLYPGGSVSLNQTRAVGDRWIVDHVVEQLNVRALMVKSIRQRLVYDTSDYEQIARTTYKQAVKMLLDMPLPAH